MTLLSLLYKMFNISMHRQYFRIDIEISINDTSGWYLSSKALGSGGNNAA